MAERVMSATQELLLAQKIAGDLELIPWWKRMMSHLTPLGYAYVNGEPRKYYRYVNGRYYYRRVAECELHRRH